MFASITLDRWRRRVASKTAADLEWRLRTAMDHFGPLRLDEIDAAAADEFVDWALREREAIREAAAAGQPLTEAYVDARTSCTHHRRRRGLSNSSINKVLVAVRRVLREAVRQRLIEFNPLEGRHVNLARRQIRMPRVKTDASARIVPTVPALHEILLAHRADHGWGAAEPVFATRNGTRNTPDNLRRRVIAGVHGRANELLRGDGGAEIAQLTPHTLRRPFASLLAEVGVSPRRAMYLLGQTDPKLTMRVYQ